jgi:hypothetical protein
MSRWPSYFDAAAGACSSSVAAKLIVGGLIVAAIGVPILETWKALLLGTSLLAIVFGDFRQGWWRLGAVAAVVLVVVSTKAVLPRADIAEAHNAFTVIHDGEPLQQGLPPEIFRSWKTQFDAIYPPDSEPYSSRSQWRLSGSPTALFTQSSDAIWRTPKYTRQVDAIEFESLGEFRAGFANELQYNFWAGEMRRESMPFYVMYELTPAAVGSRLSWRGQVFWERASGGFEEILHNDVAERAIVSEDAGKRVYAVFFPQRDQQLHFRLHPSLSLRASGWMEAMLSIAGGLSVLFLTIRPRWGSYLRALSIVAVSYLLMVSFVSVSEGKYLGMSYPPHGGGDDGLLHDAWGREMAMLVGDGNVVEALQGKEAVYWFTPGTRYVRMVEKLVFGDTYLLFALLVACLPIVLFYLMSYLAGIRAAWGIVGFFWAAIVGSLSYLQHIANAKLGYGETIATGCFALGVVLMLKTQAVWGGTERNLPMTWCAGAALAASMFIRPNFAIAVVWMALAYACASLKRRDAGPVVALGLGLALALWMPFHNWYYGGEFYLISQSGATVSLSLGVGDYVSAMADLVRGRAETDSVILVSRQLQAWLWNPGFLVRPWLLPVAWAAHAIELLALAVTVGVIGAWVCRGGSRHTDLAVVAVAAIAAHVPMLFIFFTTNSRYAMLGWDLNVVVLVAWFVRWRWPASPSSPRAVQPV